MNKFLEHNGLVLPLDIANIDTDIILPKQFLKNINRIGFGKYLFYDWRYKDTNKLTLNHKFIMNHPSFKNASILLTRENFGCGSSREHAPWALLDYGIKAIIAPSFADIFYTNALNNHLVPIRLKNEEINELFEIIFLNPGIFLKINIKKLEIEIKNKKFFFKIDLFQRDCIMYGIDSIDLTLQYHKEITYWEKHQQLEFF